MKILFLADEESKMYWNTLRKRILKELILLYHVET